MEDNPARENKKVWLKNKQEKARRQDRRLCSLHRPAEPGGRARNYGLFRELQGVVR